jgi:hypothetical protein
MATKPRIANSSRPHVVKVSTNAKVVRMLDFLVKDGRYGKTRANVAELLVLEQLQQMRLPFAPQLRKGPKVSTAKPSRRKRGRTA